MDHIDFAGIAQVIFAMVAVASFVKTWLNGLKTDKDDAKTDLVVAQTSLMATEQTKLKADMGELAKNTNSIKDALIAAEKKVSKQEGKDEQRQETDDAVGKGTSTPGPR